MKQVLRRLIARMLLRVPRSIFTDKENFEMFQAMGVHMTPVHFYSPIPNTAEINPAIFEKASDMPGVDQNLDAQARLLSEVAALDYLDQFFRLFCSGKHPLFNLEGAITQEDAAMLYAMIRKLRPARIIEIGGGQSTLVSIAALQENGNADVRHVVIDPYPQPYLQGELSAKIELIAKKVEDVPLSLFEELGENDILFIDSTHTVRVGGDVIFEVLEVLPRLKPGVFVHIHDIFLPHHYPKDWVIKRHIFWAEQYLLQAFLAFNKSFEIVWCYGMMLGGRADDLAAKFWRAPKFGAGGSLWLRRTA